MSAARQWRLVWVLTGGAGHNEPSTKELTGPQACLNHGPERDAISVASLLDPGKEATRSEGMNPGGFTPSGGGLTMDSRGVLVAPAGPSRFGTTATAMD